MSESNQNLPDDLKGEKLLDHNYDDIQELDNPLPAWWTYLFYVSIIFSFFYMIIFTFFVDSPGARADRAVKKITQPVVQVEAAAESANDSTGPVSAQAASEPVFSADEDTLETGKKVFLTKCMACHGSGGEGLVGPNLTDKYWIHGKGTEPDMYKVVTDGVPDKGMIPWKTMISDDEIRAVVVYIKTLQGTSPPNPKAPQGELVE